LTDFLVQFSYPMLLQDLHELTKLGAQKPMSFWWPDYQPKAKPLAEDLSALAEGIEKGTGVRENLESLIELLSSEEPNEYELARKISYAAELFREQLNTLSEEDRGLVFRFISDSKKFYGRAQTSELLERERNKLKTALSPEEQTARDRRLFELEGMMYCLEYYLAMYKAILDAPDESAKRKIIESTEIIFDFGQLPGLWIDFDKDEVLQKFILKILNDDFRVELQTAYFQTKAEFAKILMSCDKQGTCQASYHETTLDETIQSFKKLLKTFIAVFQKAGLEQLSSYFLTPFGKNAKLSEIKI